MGLFSSVGKAINSLTGATSASNQAYKQSVNLANMSYQQQKEFAQNAHQWEAEDLKKAGYNPALTTGASSSGAIAGGGSTGGSGSAVHSGIDLLSSIAGTINQTKQTNANIDVAYSQAELNSATAIKAIAEAENLPKQTKAQLINAFANQETANATSALYKRQTFEKGGKINLGKFGDVGISWKN